MHVSALWLLCIPLVRYSYECFSSEMVYDGDFQVLMTKKLLETCNVTALTVSDNNLYWCNRLYNWRCALWNVDGRCRYNLQLNITESHSYSVHSTTVPYWHKNGIEICKILPLILQDAVKYNKRKQRIYPRLQNFFIASPTAITSTMDFSV